MVSDFTSQFTTSQMNKVKEAKVNLHFSGYYKSITRGLNLVDKGVKIRFTRQAQFFLYPDPGNLNTGIFNI